MIKKYIKVGHRGAAGLAAENSLDSFEQSLKHNVQMVELDVHLSKDNELIVIHDQTLNRTTDTKGKVCELTLEEIKKAKMKDGQSVPTLNEVINKINGRCGINIEIKDKQAAELVIKEWERCGLDSNSLISSNHVSALQYVKKVQPDITTALIYYATRTYLNQFIFSIASWLAWPISKKIILSRAKKADVKWINIAKEFLFPKFIKNLQAKGYKVGVWVVNKKRHISRCAKYGVDAIISDYPDKI